MEMPITMMIVSMRQALERYGPWTGTRQRPVLTWEQTFGRSSQRTGG